VSACPASRRPDDPRSARPGTCEGARRSTRGIAPVECSHDASMDVHSSAVVGATAGWAAYFAWAYRDFVGDQEIAAGVVGAILGLVVAAVLRLR
jgi:hypothetical protein